MFERADAHMHCFNPGFVELLPDSCRRTAPDELTLYTALAKRAGIVKSLVVGFEGMPAHHGNNDYLQKTLKDHPSMRATAFVSRPQDLTVEQLETWRRQQFVGISFYVLDAAMEGAVRSVSSQCWEWIAQHRWLVSVNSHGELWNVWASILDRFPGVRLLVSHLGSPPAQKKAPAMSDARDLMAHTTALSRYPNVFVKFSGLYAMTDPNYAYPHEAAWPFVDVALQAFGEKRLLWASDFSPVLEYVSFDQTWAVLDQIPFINNDQRRLIAGANLLKLLGEIL